jgi:oxygen-independent coproporphyrinogen-3 oxidase
MPSALADGFRTAELERTTGLSVETVQPTLAALKSRGLLESTGDHWKPTELGFRFLNDLQAAFLPAAPGERPSNVRPPQARASV